MAAQPPPWSPKQDKPPAFCTPCSTSPSSRARQGKSGLEDGRPKLVRKEPGILTATQLRRLLLAADEKLRPTLAIGPSRAFALQSSADLTGRT